MKKKFGTIVFFGSGPVAAQSLRLLEASFEVEAVITKPRPAHHTGSVPVLEVAEELHLPVYTAADKSTLDSLFAAASFKSRVGVLIDFGIIVSQQVINYFPLGIVNSHFSLLPEWRGADPITFAILSGQKTTGVSLMLLVEAMDEGPLLAQSEYIIPAKATTPELTEALIEVSSNCLNTVLPPYMNGELQSVSQDVFSLVKSKEPTYSRKLTKADATLDWRKSAKQLEREIRAFVAWPKSKAQFGGLELVVTSASAQDGTGPIGTTAVIDKKPAVFCNPGVLMLDTVKPIGKKEMTGKAFLAGYKQAFLAAS